MGRKEDPNGRALFIEALSALLANNEREVRKYGIAAYVDKANARKHLIEKPSKPPLRHFRSVCQRAHKSAPRFVRPVSLEGSLGSKLRGWQASYYYGKSISLCQNTDLEDTHAPETKRYGSAAMTISQR
jgi:hypothetical protein